MRAGRWAVLAAVVVSWWWRRLRRARHRTRRTRARSSARTGSGRRTSTRTTGTRTRTAGSTPTGSRIRGRSGRVKAIVLFVDFEDARRARSRRSHRSTTASRSRTGTSSRRSCRGSDMASYGPLQPRRARRSYKWYRMPKTSTEWRMDYRSNDPARRLSADGPGRVHRRRGRRGRRRRRRLQRLRPDLRRPGAQPDGDRQLAGAQQLRPPDRRRRQRPRQRRRPRPRHVQLGLQAAQPRDRARVQPHRGLQRGHGRHVPLHGPVGHDGQHLRQRAGLHRLEQVEARLAQRRRGRLRRLRRRQRAHADAGRAAPDGTGAEARRDPHRARHTTLVAELRAPLGVDSVAGGNTARYCESGGVLLYTVDSTLRNGLGVYKVLDAMPGSTGWGCSDETSISTLGRGQRRGPSHFEVPELGVTFDLTSTQRRRHAARR